MFSASEPAFPARTQENPFHHHVE